MIEICFLREGQEGHAPLEESVGFLDPSQIPERSMELLSLHQNTISKTSRPASGCDLTEKGSALNS